MLTNQNFPTPLGLFFRFSSFFSRPLAQLERKIRSIVLQCIIIQLQATSLNPTVLKRVEIKIL